MMLKIPDETHGMTYLSDVEICGYRWVGCDNPNCSQLFHYQILMKSASVDTTYEGLISVMTYFCESPKEIEAVEKPVTKPHTHRREN